MFHQSETSSADGANNVQSSKLSCNTMNFFNNVQCGLFYMSVHTELI